MKFRNYILGELHSCHTGASSMKSLARSYFWWPAMDKEIENITQNCNECLNIRQNQFYLRGNGHKDHGLEFIAIF